MKLGDKNLKSDAIKKPFKVRAGNSIFSADSYWDDNNTKRPRYSNPYTDKRQRERVELLMEKGYSPECAEKILGVVYSKVVEYGR